MKAKTLFLTLMFSLVTLILPACGGSSDSGSNKYGDSSSSLAQYAGKWELFQPGNNPTESATFTLKISANGNASITHNARVGYSNTVLESGDGYAELNGSVLFVEITSGKSKGTTLRLTAQDGRLYTADGQSFTKQY
ncbi:MAG: hypothetical protein HDS18_06535 [Bacteroides sp.]|nr:hypothetical protein [Bacteroides sp.]